ncbi:uncharacterized protein [Triticum aestivum]|uniref:uncharacterized protein isoform X4 n=1 Tax=Triticum aestivum TaxID=4565 RepID=UPI001D025BC6|nr:uncharacterized protein LOC123159779 isoform X4 [Triticum aestivum]
MLSHGTMNLILVVLSSTWTLCFSSSVSSSHFSLSAASLHTLQPFCLNPALTYCRLSSTNGFFLHPAATAEMASAHGELEKKLQDPNAPPMFLPLDFLQDITCDFSTESKLGEGGYGIVYKGVLRTGKIIAVKKLFEMRLKEETFQNEVSYLMGIKHQNIVQLKGYCAESRWEAIERPSGSGKHVFAEIPKRLLCFEYISNKSLKKHISDESLGLEWNMRYDIIKGICSGMHFLHDECHIVHLDLKPENILIDSTMTAKIADFGLSRIFGEQESQIITDNRAGTCGYMAPEYLIRGVVSNKADIFSMGVIVIEIITGHRDYPDFQQDNPHSAAASLQQFTEKVHLSWRNKLMSTPDYKSTETSVRQVRQCIGIALECVHPSMEKRPTAKDILEMLNGLDKMVADYEPLSDMQCKDMLQALNTTVSNDLTSQNRSITNDMLNKETDSKVVANAKSVEGLLHTPLPESNKINEMVKWWAAKASCKPQPTRDTTIVQAIPTLTQIISREVPKERMISLDINQTESWIATGHENGYIDICDYIMQKSVCLVKIEDVDAPVDNIKFIERKQWFIVGLGAGSGKIYVYSYKPEVQKITSFRVKRYLIGIDSLAVHPTQPYVLSSCSGYIQLWDWDRNWECVKKFEKLSYFNMELQLAFNPKDPNEFASTSNDMTVKLWNLDSLKPKYILDGHSAKVNCVEFFTTDDNKQYLITGSSDKFAMQIWDMQTKACVQIFGEFKSSVISVVSHPSLPVLIIGTRDGTIHLWGTHFRYKRQLTTEGGANGLTCLTPLGRVVMGNESALFTMEILDEEPDAIVEAEEAVAS